MVFRPFRDQVSVCFGNFESGEIVYPSDWTLGMRVDFGPWAPTQHVVLGTDAILRHSAQD